MFTGIVQGRAQVIAIQRHDEFMRLTLELPEARCDNLQSGASIAINGTCLTVTQFDGNRISFDLIAATLNTTNLGALNLGDHVNFERAARIGDEIGGHTMSGHIYQTVKILAIEKSEDNCVIWFERPKSIARYLLPKGFVGLNGCSLTLAQVEPERFCVYLIPETLRITTFGELSEGSDINVEVDPQTQAIVDTVERYLTERQQL
ncbi:riboflavin synthase subunit alpha [Marinobacterium sp. D7]|uniref:riboflavin synthase subunit alpha n=1 Tax=Marinobacterium ramblicola TaxID=2849041 RepID=UPI001C2DC49C|nr:riboflavin synthase subunit alpha [Marinobacterium ramblicola]MBV1789566.1 riboflavin synthase subunit alpha [Marinobacterium ramblicola]